MDSTSAPGSIRGRSRGMGRGHRRPKPGGQEAPPGPPCSPSTLLTFGRGQGLLPRTPEPNFARGRGLGRGAVVSEPPAELIARARAVAKPGPERSNAPGPVAEVRREPENGASAPPPPMVPNTDGCRELAGALEFGSDDSDISDHGDDLTFANSAIRRALEEEDSDVEDMIGIGRQLREAQVAGREALPTAPKLEPAARPDKNAQHIISCKLSTWRLELREENLECLNSALEGELAFRWRTEPLAQVVAWLESALAAAEDPCAAALALMNWCGPRKSGSRAEAVRALPRLDGALDILESVLSRSADLRRRFLARRSLRSRRYAFFLGQREGMDALRRVVAIFRLDDDLAVPTMKALVDQLLEGGVFKEACQFIGVLGLQHLYSAQEVLLPCIAEGRINVVEDYVKGSEAAQRQLLRFLDNNFDQQHSVRQMLENCHPELLQVRHDLLSFTALKKLTLRLQKLFHQPNSVVPRVSGERCSFDLSLLLHERYVRRIKRPDWLTAIQGAVGDSHENAVSLVEYLIDYRLPGAARRWADFYNVTAAEVASLSALGSLEDEEEGEEARKEEVAAMSAARAQNDFFLAFPLDPDHDIEFVQEEEGLWMAIGLAGRAEKIGFDAEWTSLYGQSETSISLLQMALPNCVFIFDMQRLPAAVESADVWHYFRAEVFEKNQKKIFYSALQDIRMIWASVPELKTPPPDGAEDAPPASSYRGVVDLEQLVTHCSAADLDFFPQPTTGGLSGLVHACLGRPLCKTERLSNWRARPLSRGQRVYAALDAHCLISVHDWMEKRKEELNLQDLNLGHAADLEERKKKKKKK